MLTQLLTTTTTKRVPSQSALATQAPVTTPPQKRGERAHVARVVDMKTTFEEILGSHFFVICKIGKVSKKSDLRHM